MIRTYFPLDYFYSLPFTQCPYYIPYAFQNHGLSCGFLIYKNHQLFSIDGVVVSAFDTQYDAAESIGFILDDGEDRLLYATDTHYLHYKSMKFETLEVMQVFSADRVIGAIARAVDRGKRSMDYVRGILKSWQEEGYDSPGDVGSGKEPERRMSNERGLQALIEKINITATPLRIPP